MVDPKPNPFVFDVSEQNFQRQVLERSFNVPVFVDFWAGWCGPCKVLTPVLESLAQRMNGRFVLAKVDADANKRLTQQLGVQGLPTVKVFQDGKVVDGFTGALPENALVEFIEKVAPSLTDKLLEKIAWLRDSGDTDTAIAGLRQILREEPDHVASRVLLAKILLDGNQLDDAKKVLARLESHDGDSQEVKAVFARVHLMEEAKPVEPLRALLAEDPDCVDARLALGKALLAHEHHEEGLDHLLEAVRLSADPEDKRARDAMLKAFEALGNGDPRVVDYRSRLSMLLFN